MKGNEKMLARAIALAATSFADTTDKSGRPYIEHCLHVMESVRHLGDVAMIAAVLHDIVEDTSMTPRNLRSRGYPHEAIEAICALSRLDGEGYLESFIPRCSENPLAKAIKMADIEHNMQASRIKGLRKKDFDRLAKYSRAYTYLSE